MNRRKNMNLKTFWVEKGEYEDIVTFLECNERDRLFDVMFQIYKRGDFGDE